MATLAPDPKDVLDFKFRALRNIRLQDNQAGSECLKQLGATPTQRLAVSNTLGFVFAGKIEVFPFRALDEKSSIFQEGTTA